MKIMTLVFLFLANLSVHSAHAQVNPVIPFKKVVWIWLENTPYGSMINQQYIYNLWVNHPAVRFSQMKQVSPVTQGNTVAMISGNDYGIKDNQMVRIFTPTIVNLLESKNVTWKVYADAYPGACYPMEGTGDYRRYRVPFLSVSQIQTDRYLCSKIVSFKFLGEDTNYGSLPDFSMVIPGLSGSGATTSVGTASSTLKTILDPIVSNPDLMAQATVIISTTTNADAKNPELFTMILGNGVADYAMTIDSEFNHYHLLRTIENGFNLGHLNQNDAKVEPMLGFWKP